MAYGETWTETLNKTRSNVDFYERAMQGGHKVWREHGNRWGKVLSVLERDIDGHPYVDITFVAVEAPN